MKRLLLFLALLAFHTSAKADYLGVFAGTEFCSTKKINAPTVAETTFTQLLAGLSLRVDLYDWLGLQPDLLIDFWSLDGVRMTYLHIPLALQFRFPFLINQMKANVFLGAGAELGFRLAGDGAAPGEGTGTDHRLGNEQVFSYFGVAGMEAEVSKGVWVQLQFRYILGSGTYFSVEDLGFLNSFGLNRLHTSAAILFSLGSDDAPPKKRSKKKSKKEKPGRKQEKMIKDGEEQQLEF